MHFLEGSALKLIQKNNKRNVIINIIMAYLSNNNIIIPKGIK